MQFIKRITHADYLAAHEKMRIPVQKEDGSVVTDPAPEDLVSLEEWDAMYGGDVLIAGPVIPEDTDEERVAVLTEMYEKQGFEIVKDDLDQVDEREGIPSPMTETSARR